MPGDPQRLAYWLLKDINRAIRDFQMIIPGDRVAVAVSGGKDSLSLLQLLDIRRRQAPGDYEIFAIHVLGDARGTTAEIYMPLLEWLEGQAIPFQVVPMHLPEGETLPLDCHRCTWNRRKILFEAAEQMGCNVVAFGHHAGDLAQTTLMNLLYHGKLESMAPRREYFDGKLRLIRPLCYTEEKELRRFSRACQFPDPPPVCPNSETSQRSFIRGILEQVKKEAPQAETNLLRSGLKACSISQR